MAQSAEVVIVDDAGTEHVFPPGFDPKRAAAIVGKQGNDKTNNLDRLVSSIPRDARGFPAVSSHVDEQPSALSDMLGPLAHPQTIADFGHILGMPVDSVRSAMTRALAMSVARGPASTAISATGRGLEAVGNSRAARAAQAAGGAEAAWHLDPKGLAVATLPPVLKFVGRGMQRAGRALAPAVEEAAPAASAATEVVKNTLPDQKLLNELAIEARRAKIRLTPDTEKAAIEAVTKGASPKEAVATVAPAQASSPVASAGAAPVKGQLSAAEAKEVDRLIRSGKTDAQARTLIETSRKLNQMFGTSTPTAAQTRFPKGMRGKAPE